MTFHFIGNTFHEVSVLFTRLTISNIFNQIRENIDRYFLHIAEDDGEVDTDFPALDNREPISKFGFAKLALVESDEPIEQVPKSSTVITM